MISDEDRLHLILLQNIYLSEIVNENTGNNSGVANTVPWRPRHRRGREGNYASSAPESPDFS